MSRYAILKDRQVVPASDVFEWARWLEAADRQVALDNDVVGVGISTIFLGLNQSFGMGPDLWFETMIIGGPHDQYTARYTTWEEAEAGHRCIVEALRARDPEEEFS